MQTLEVEKGSRFTTIFFATTAIACFAYFAIALLLMHALRPERALATTWISGYAVGSNRPPFRRRSAWHALAGDPVDRPAAHRDLPAWTNPLR